MKKIFILVFFLYSSLLSAETTPGKEAPQFELTDTTGQLKKLSDFKGAVVVLEWFNKDCPFVKKHYGSKNMQTLQKKYADKKVKWLTIISSAPGKQGHENGSEAEKTKSTLDAHPTSILLDPNGTVGRLYGAKTTPHMFIISPDQKVIYAGAIDDKPSYDQADIKSARNFVQLALDETLAGRPVSITSHRAYGCAVKY